MKVLIPILLALLAQFTQAQIPSTAFPGTFFAGTEDITFTDNSLGSPNVDARVYYPATAAGNNAPFAAGAFPVIAFGHGFNLDYLDYEETCGHLATWGYIVVTPDVQNGFNVDHQEFARELAACIQHIQAEGGNSNSSYFQHVDAKSGVFGHSMGGGASALVPSVFPQINAVSGLAAAETNPSAIAALANYAGPYQVISGSSDNTAGESGNQIPMYNAATGTKQWISITGGAHCKFTDGNTICDLVSSAGSISREDQKFLAKKYLTAFFNYQLKNDNDALPFLCGDSIAVDVQAGRLANTTNLNCTSVGTLSAASPAWECWPNPASCDLHLAGISGLSIYALDGRLLRTLEWEGETNVISLGNWAPGMYWLRDAEGGMRRLSIVR